MRTFNHIAKLVRTKRINHPKSYSQNDLSLLLGYKNGQFISNVERGLCNVPLKIMKRVSEVLEISSEELISAILKDQQETLSNFFSLSSSESPPSSEV